VDLRNAAFEILDPNLPVSLALLAPPHRIRVGLIHYLVDLSGQSALRHRRPARYFDGQLSIHRRQHLVVGDQIGAIHDRLKQSIVDVTGFEDFGHLRQRSRMVRAYRSRLAASPCLIRNAAASSAVTASMVSTAHA
jgi:hypothetical protein